MTLVFDLTLNPSPRFGSAQRPKERDLQPTPTKAIKFFCMVFFRFNVKIDSPLFFGERGLRIKSKKQETNF
jgi:hypothetical protein